jgi:hypothetical protein
MMTNGPSARFCRLEGLPTLSFSVQAGTTLMLACRLVVANTKVSTFIAA